MANHVLRVRASRDTPGYIQHIFFPPGSFKIGPTDFWLTYDMLIDPLLLDALLQTDPKTNISHSFVFMDGGSAATSLNLSVGRDFYDLGLWFDPTFPTTDNAGSVPPPSLGWHTVEMHYNFDQRYTFYIDGAAVWDEVGDGFTNRGGITGLNIGMSLLDIPGVGDPGYVPTIYYDNVKIGTSRGAGDYFSDDFESGLSKWTLRGDVEIVVGPIMPTDTGVTVTSSLARTRVLRSLTDAALAVSDALGRTANRQVTDTGMTFSDSVVAKPTKGRVATDTGLTVTDSIKKTARKVISDRVFSLLDTLVARTNGHNVSVTISERGLTVSDSIAASRVFLRSVPTSFPEPGLTIRDGIIIKTVPPHAPTKPHADFTWTSSLLAVTFTDTSTPGSAPIESWSWSFGDGATSSATNPTHTYATAGTYVVRLTVTTVYGSSTVAKPVTVSGTVGAGIHIDGVIL